MAATDPYVRNRFYSIALKDLQPDPNQPRKKTARIKTVQEPPADYPEKAMTYSGMRAACASEV